MIRLLLSAPSVFPWQRADRLAWRGLPPPDPTLATLRDTDPESPGAPATWTAALARAAPPFGAILVRGDAVLAAVDRARSFPLFWAEHDGGLVLGDDARAVRDALGGTPTDAAAFAEARLCGFVSGTDTLDPRVKQMRSGDVLQCATGRGGPGARIIAAPLPPRDAPDPRASGTPEALMRATMARTLESLGGRQLVVPLTGGYDSRLIAILARDAGYDRVLCVGSHRAADRETTTGRAVAQRLGFDWTHAGADPDRWRAWYASADRRRFYDATDGLAALPPLLEWTPLMELRRTGRADGDAVIVPGHFGHFVTGSSTPDRRGPASATALANLVARRRYALNPWPADPAVAAAARARLEAAAREAARDAADLDDAVDRWEWREYATKREGAVVRAFEWAGFEWRLPFADPAVVACWRAVSRRDRLDSRRHHELVDRLGNRWRLPPANPGRARAVRLRRWARRTGLLGPARALRRLARRLDRGAIGRQDAPGWAALVDPAVLRRSYTGLEGAESYLVRDWLAGCGGDLV